LSCRYQQTDSQICIGEQRARIAIWRNSVLKGFPYVVIKCVKWLGTKKQILVDGMNIEFLNKLKPPQE
jgi:hypothetical protein